MAQYLLAYGFTAAFFLLIDLIWLSRIAKSLYVGQIGNLLLDTPRVGAAALFYAVYVIGIVVFAVAPAIKAQSLTMALGYGALFGFFAYATYDMTNYATLRGWSLAVTVIDVGWGTALTGVAATVGYLGTWFITRS
jgi:uncharacterized membrane protein